MIETIPVELVVHILSYLDLRVQRKLRLLSKSFHDLLSPTTLSTKGYHIYLGALVHRPEKYLDGIPVGCKKWVTTIEWSPSYMPAHSEFDPLGWSSEHSYRKRISSQQEFLAKKPHIPYLTTLFRSFSNLTTVNISSLPFPFPSDINCIDDSYGSTIQSEEHKLNPEYPDGASFHNDDLLDTLLAIHASRAHATGKLTRLSTGSINLEFLDAWFNAPDTSDPLGREARDKKWRRHEWTAIQEVLSALKELQIVFWTDAGSIRRYYEDADHPPREAWTWTDEQRDLARHLGWLPNIVHPLPSTGFGEVESHVRLYRRRKPLRPSSPPHHGAPAWHVFSFDDCSDPGTLPRRLRRLFLSDGQIAEFNASSCEDSEDHRREQEKIKCRTRSPRAQAAFLERRKKRWARWKVAPFSHSTKTCGIEQEAVGAGGSDEQQAAASTSTTSPGNATATEENARNLLVAPVAGESQPTDAPVGERNVSATMATVADQPGPSREKTEPSSSAGAMIGHADDGGGHDDVAEETRDVEMTNDDNEGDGNRDEEPVGREATQALDSTDKQGTTDNEQIVQNTNEGVGEGDATGGGLLDPGALAGDAGQTETSAGATAGDAAGHGEDVEMSDANNDEDADGDEEDNNEEDEDDGDDDNNDASDDSGSANYNPHTPSSTTFNTFDPHPPLPRPVPGSFLHASLRVKPAADTPRPKPPPGATKLSLSSLFYAGVSLSRVAPTKPLPNSALQSLHLVVYPFQFIPARFIVGGGTHRFFHPPETKHSKSCNCDGETRRKRLLNDSDVSLYEGVIRTWPQLAALTTLTINNAAFESKDLEDVIFYCGAQLNTLKLHNVGLVFSPGGEDDVEAEVEGIKWTAYGAWVRFLGRLSRLHQPPGASSASLLGHQNDVDPTDVFYRGVNVWKHISKVEFRGLLASKMKRDVIDEYDMRKECFVAVDEEEREGVKLMDEERSAGGKTACMRLEDIVAELRELPSG